MELYEFWEHFQRVDRYVPSDVREWAIERTLVNREIRDYYGQFDQNAACVPGPVFSYGSRYHLGTVGTDWSGSIGSFSSAPGVTISTPNFSVGGNANWSTPSFDQWSYNPPQDVSSGWSYYDHWSYDWGWE